LETKLKSQPKIYFKTQAFAMRQPTSGTGHDYFSNARFSYRSQGFLLVEGIKTFNTEIIMTLIQGTTFNFLDPRFYLWRISLFIIKQHEIQSFLLSFECFHTFNVPQITVWFLCLRFRQRSIERAMDLTDSFTWEDLPTRDADTGHLTAAGWIPRILKYSRNATIIFLCFHTVQSTIRIVTSHETVYIVWYPFDWTVTPFYELVIISQVIISKQNSHIFVLRGP